jgi:hypothetical protein
MMTRQPFLRRAVAAGVGVCALALAPALHARELIDRVLAVVSGTVITLSDARAALALGFVDPVPGHDPMEDAVGTLIDRRLVLDEVSRYAAPEPAPDLVAARMTQLKGRFPAEGAWARVLAEAGLTETEAQALVRDELRVAQYIDRRFEAILPPTDDEIRDYYQANQQQFTRDGRPMTLDEARPAVTGRLLAERRRQAIDAWVQRLRRRGDVIDLYLPKAGSAPETKDPDLRARMVG